jgi:hypothetical protein
MKSLDSRRRFGIRLLTFALLVPSSMPVARAATTAQSFTVTSAGDSGSGTLRQAILDANAAPGLDTIVFAIVGSPTIRPSTPLPIITDPAVVDGTTQPGYAGSPVVEIDGSGAGSEADGLVITGGGSTIKGLVVNRFDGSGIRIREKGENRIIGNFVGTDASGTEARGNGTGVVVEDVALETRGGFGNLIGGAKPGEGNLLSGNGRGVLVRDVFGANSGLVTYTTLEGNLIGTDASGESPLGNRGDGVVLDEASRIVIGGREAGAGNVIAFNDGIGVTSDRGNLGARILSNAIFGNDGGGIQYGVGSIGNPPVITSVEIGGGQVRIRGGVLYSGPSTTRQVLLQFFANDACDPGGKSQGERFLGEVELNIVDSDRAVFDRTFQGSIPPAGGVTATSTDYGTDTTSRFGLCVGDTGGCVAPFITVPPAALDVRSGGTATFSITATGSGPLSYQWFERVNGTYVAIQGATAPVYTTPPLTGFTNYRVHVTNTCGEADDIASASVCTDAPVIVAQPEDRYVSVGEFTSFFARPEPLNSYYGYQWYRGESGDTSDPIVGATRISYGLIATESPASFWVRITNACGSTDSATVRVIPGPIVRSVKISTDASGKAQLVIKGSEFTERATVYVGNAEFLKEAVVRKGTTIIQKGKLSNGLSIKKAFPPGEPVQIAIFNAHGNAAVVTYTR